jgi:hypothetical protein
METGDRIIELYRGGVYFGSKVYCKVDNSCSTYSQNVLPATFRGAA